MAPAGPPALGAAILYWWPDDGWQRGAVARICKRAPFSHIVRYRRPTAAFAGDVATLLDAPSYGIRWVLPLSCRRLAGGVSRLPSVLSGGRVSRP